MKRFTGKAYFQWLGFQHGIVKRFKSPPKSLPLWALDAYGRGWINGFYSVSK
jgi:hypothetical protein